MTEAARVYRGHLTIRSALAGDIQSLVTLYADDELGKTREALGADPAYLDGFAAIDSDPNHILAVGELDGDIVATLLLSFIPGLSRHGAWRAQVESMRVAQAYRGQGLGREILDWAIATARERGCMLMQLTSDRRRPEAHRFYERAGFSPTHVGFKLDLDAT